MARELDATFYKPAAIMLPADGEARLAAATLPPGTAIVAAAGQAEPGDDRQLIYYEQPAGRVGQTFADRALIAHGRAWYDRGGSPPRHGSSTHKMAAMPSRALAVVGTYNPREGEITLTDDPALCDRVAGWLGIDAADMATLLTVELQSTSAKHVIRRELRRALANPLMRRHPAVGSLARRHGHEDLLGERPDHG